MNVELVAVGGFLLYGLVRLGRWGWRELTTKGQARKSALEETARLLHLNRAGSSLTGIWEGFDVSIRDSLEQPGEDLLLIVESQGRQAGAIPADLVIRNRGAHEGKNRPSPAKATGTGDRDFDDVVHVEGERVTAAALLDATVRPDIERAVRRGDTFLVEGGRLTTELSETDAGGRVLRESIETALRLVKNLAGPSGDKAVLLARNARKDTQARVRLRNLSLLLRFFPDHPLVRPTLRALLRDRSYEVRFRAARALGGEGFRELKNFVIARTERRDLAARSLSYMARHFEAGRVLPLARSAVSSTVPPLRASALKVMAALEDGETERLAVTALKSMSREVQLAAVEVLGRIGTAAAVVPLKDLAGRRRFDPTLRRAINAAVLRIKERLEGAEAGQVSLADGRGPGGQVSLAGDEGQGTISLTEE